MFLSMFHSTTPPFSVAKFTIEGAGEGAEHFFAPPRLSSSQTASVTGPAICFPINPFSLSRSSFIKSHASHGSVISSSSNSMPLSPDIISTDISHLAPASSASSSCCVQSLFPNPFLIKQKISPQGPQRPQSSSILSGKPATDISVQHTDTLSSPSLPSPPYSTIISSQGGDSSASTRRPRKPRSDRVLASSSFRPRVMAVDRLFSWRTPYGLSHDKSLLAELPPALAESAKMSITGALATSSRSTYAAGLLRFNQFCDRWEISEVARMPASYALLCAFIGNYKGSNSGRTIKSWLSGIRAWHLTNHAPWYGDDKWVQMARISANKEGSRHKCPLCAPVSIEHLLTLRKAINLSDHFHAAVWAVALVTFFGCRRLGETTVSSVSSFNPCLHVLRSAEYVCCFILFSCSS
jgi:hypothetical protein